MSPTIRASDFYLLKQCNRQVYLDYHGDSSQYRAVTGYQAWVTRAGIDFEQQVIASFPFAQPGQVTDRLSERFKLTLQFMQSGAEVIYQGVLINGDLIGTPDLLMRVDGSSRFGPYHYRPVDIKSAHSAEDEHRLQVMAYISLLEAIQGVRPDGALLLRVAPEAQVNNQIAREEKVFYDHQVYTEHLTNLRELAGGREPRPFMSSTCGKCGWQGVCRPIAESTRDASLIPGIQRRVWEQLHERGMGTLAAVAAAEPEMLLNLKGVGEKTAHHLVRQAQALHTGQAIQLALPALTLCDEMVFFDIESLPSESLFYLMGTTISRYGELSFEYDLAYNRADECDMWEAFLTRMAALSPCPVYHYGGYEKASVKRLIERYGADPRAYDLLDRLVDLERVLKDSVVLPLKGYSLKDVAPWLGFAWTGKTKGADDSMLEYIYWLADNNTDHLDHIVRYNEDDCYATVAVYNWLVSLLTPH